MNEIQIELFLLDMSKEYIENEKLTKVKDDKYGQGFSKFMGKAIISYYK